jgi:predicted amidohydrolase
MGVYRKSHIPDGPGYQEKYYFRPGDTGFRVWDTKHGRIGVGICWDQWYPECARAMVLMGADVLLYPTAIGSEPHDSSLDTAARWRRAMQGHAVSNVTPVAAANRVGDRERPGVLRHVASSPTIRAKSSATSIARKRALSSPPSTWMWSIAHAPLGGSSATGGRTSTVRWSIR